MDTNEQLETIASELIKAFDINMPPVPVESMLKSPKEGMWVEVDINQLSGTFLSFRDQFSPRMSLARMLARHIVSSPWGKERGLMQLIKDQETLHLFARMLLMPREMIEELSSGSRSPAAMSMRFEVPEEEARLRLRPRDFDHYLE
jgi:hypothetical protein